MIIYIVYTGVMISPPIPKRPPHFGLRTPFLKISEHPQFQGKNFKRPKTLKLSLI